MLKKVTGLLLIICALAVLCVLVFGGKTVPLPTIRRPDGTIITLVAVTYGTNHTMVWGKPYQRSLYKILPPKLKSLSGATAFNYSTGQTNVPVFWLHDSTPATNTPSPTTVFVRRLGPAPGSGAQSFRLLDEFGCEYDPQGYNTGENYLGVNGTFSHYQLNTGNPHGKIVGLRVYDSKGKTNLLGTFMIPGATLASSSAAKPVSIPPAQDGQLTFQLTSLLTGFRSAPYDYTKMTNGVLFSQTEFHVTKNGVPARGWFVNTLRITDAHGKVFQYRPNVRAFKGDDIILNVEGILDPADGPFKLRAEFQNHTEFSPEDAVTFKDVPFPASAETLTLGQATNVQSWQLSLENIYGVGASKPTNYFLGHQPFIAVRLTPVTNSVYLQLARAVDEAGDEIPIWSGVPKGKGEYYFSFQSDLKPNSLTLTFAVHQSKFVEFEAMPLLINTNAVSKSN